MKPILSRRTRVRPSSDNAASAAPSTRTTPAVGRSRPPIRLSKVDFPEPDGPMIETSSPLGMLTVISSSAVTCRLPANCLVTRSRSITTDYVNAFTKRVKYRGIWRGAAAAAVQYPAHDVGTAGFVYPRRATRARAVLHEHRPLCVCVD